MDLELRHLLIDAYKTIFFVAGVAIGVWGTNAIGFPPGTIVYSLVERIL